MIPPVPFLVRILLSRLCICVSRCALASAAWIMPELEAERQARRMGPWRPRP